MEKLEFFRLQTREEVLALYPRFSPVGDRGRGPGRRAGPGAGRAGSGAEAVPGFLRATMDGYAVRARDTFGASVGAPQYLEIKGEVPMGAAPERGVAPGEAWRVPTGAMLPAGADAVVMIEYTAEHPDKTLEVRRAVAPGENVLTPGEDVRRWRAALCGRSAAAAPGYRVAGGVGDYPPDRAAAAPGSHPLLRRRNCRH